MKSVKRYIVFGIIVFVSIFLYIHYFSGSPLFDIPAMEYKLILKKDGSGVVTEKITWNLKKPFRYLSWRVSFPEPMDFELLNVKRLEGPRPSMVNKEKLKNGVGLKFWYTRSLDIYHEPALITYSFTYRVKNLIIHGEDFSQLFVKYVGGSRNSWIKELRVRVEIPDNFPTPRIFHHPNFAENLSNEKGKYEFLFENVPPHTFVEGRYIFPKILSIPSEVKVPLSMEDALRGERTYKFLSPLVTASSIAYILLSVLLPIMVYLKLGREKKVSYNAMFEREPPSKDPPEIVNAVVKNSCGLPDENGFSSAILEMIKEKSISIERNHLKLLKRPGRNEEIYKILELLAVNGIIDLKNPKPQLKKEAKAIYDLYKSWQQNISEEVKGRDFIEAKGNTIAKVTAFFLMIPGFLFLFLPSFMKGYEHVTIFSSAMGLSGFLINLFVLFLRKDILARWTEEGRVYYLKWKAFERFITDFSLLSQHPPDSIVLWEGYLIYATALGVAKKTVRIMRKMLPEPPNTPIARSSYEAPVYAYLSTIPLIARSIVSSSTSVRGGGDFGSGVGGGVGGSDIDVG